MWFQCFFWVQLSLDDFIFGRDESFFAFMMTTISTAKLMRIPKADTNKSRRIVVFLRVKRTGGLFGGSRRGSDGLAQDRAGERIHRTAAVAARHHDLGGNLDLTLDHQLQEFELRDLVAAQRFDE